MGAYEIIILIVNISVLYLAILDKQNREEKDTREYLGSIIQFSNLTFSIAAIVFVAIKIIIGIKTSYKIIKANKGASKNICLQILIVPFQTGGMGFDEGAIAQDKAFKKKKGDESEED